MRLKIWLLVSQIRAILFGEYYATGTTANGERWYIRGSNAEIVSRAKELLEADNGTDTEKN